MGAIIFQSRRDHQELDTPHHIFEPGMGDDLLSYRPGDSVEIHYYVPEAFIRQFEMQKTPEFRCYLSHGLEPTETPRYQAVIGFTIVKVKHAIMKESEGVFIFSEIMHSIVVEPDSEAGEDALLWILENLKPDWLKKYEAQVKESDHDLPEK